MSGTQTKINKHVKGGNYEKKYDIKNLNPRKNTNAERLKQQITININGDTISYFKTQSKKHYSL